MRVRRRPRPARESDTSADNASAPSGGSPPRSSEATAAPSRSSRLRRRGADAAAAARDERDAAGESMIVRSAQGRLAYPVPVELDPATDYPLGTRRPDLVRTPSGLALDRVTLPAARAGELALGGRAGDPGDARAPGRGRPESRSPAARRRARARLRARIRARRRAARDLHRASSRAIDADELEAWAVRLDELGARRTASFVREAAAVYVERGLVAE